MSIGYLNVEGQHDAVMGCKLNGIIDFCNDIEILSETWSECDKCKHTKIDNYELLKVIDPIKNKKLRGRKSGGMLIFCKTEFKKYLKVIKFTNHYVWFDIDKNLFVNMGKNPLVCAIYSQPKSSQYYSDEVWEEIEFDILTLTSIDHSNPSPFCIIGDMNGRVGEESEFNSGEIQVSNLIPGRTIIESPRRNCDKVKCKVGEKIIQLCKSYDLQVGNGRLPGDCLGNFTHHNKNTGQSTVDLALISDALYPNVDDFKVLPQTEYSDHCKVVLSLKNLKPAKTKNEN